MSDDFNTAGALDFLLNNLLEGIKRVPDTEKNTPYAKLMELFYKGAEIKEKLNKPCEDAAFPQINFIEGVNEEDF